MAGEVRQPPAAQAPVQPQQEAFERENDPVAEAIRSAERNAELQAAPVVREPQSDFQPQSRLFKAPPPPEPVVQAPAAPRIVEPAPVQQPAAVQPRMPRVEDFPPVVKAEMEASTRHVEPEDRGPMGLLKRLTHGLSRREEEPAPQPAAQPREPKLRQAPEVRRLPSQDPQLYAPRRGQIDEHGRLAPQTRGMQEEDQLEIPAFLRRQAN